MQPLPADERSSVQTLLRQLDFRGAELAVVDKELVVDFHRFDGPDRLVAYVGLNPKVRQSGNSAPVHGRISMAGSGPGARHTGRGSLVSEPRARTTAGVYQRIIGSKPAAASKPPSWPRPAR
ncbi:MAG TPA: transposase [Propionibacteriaceae bacterium]